MKKILAVLLCLALLGGLMFAAQAMTRKGEEIPVENAGMSLNAYQEVSSLTYQKTEYPMKQGLETVLLIGTDSTQQYQEETEGVQDFYNFNQADFLCLLVMDTQRNMAYPLQLNRDTMTYVPWLDVLGEYGGTEFKQLCLAFNSGDGGRKSCLNTVDAVSSLLFDAPIDHYIQLPMSGIGVLNDLVGGVPVTMPEDLSVIDPTFQKGATIRLNGTQAEQFVRARMTLENDTNLARMARQRLYLDSFQQCARKALNTDSQFTMKLLEKLSEYIQSDMTAQQLSSWITQLDNANVQPIRSYEGALKVANEHYEFYVDEASLWEMVKEAYCQ